MDAGSLPGMPETGSAFTGGHELLSMIRELTQRRRFLARTSDDEVRGERPLPLVCLVRDQGPNNFLPALKERLEAPHHRPWVPHACIDAQSVNDSVTARWEGITDERPAALEARDSGTLYSPQEAGDALKTWLDKLPSKRQRLAENARYLWIGLPPAQEPRSGDHGAWESEGDFRPPSVPLLSRRGIGETLLVPGTGLGDRSPLYFQLVPDNTMQAQLIAEYARHLKAQKVTLHHPRKMDSYVETLVRAADAKLDDLSVPVAETSEAVVFPDVTADFLLVRHGFGVAEGGLDRSVRRGRYGGGR
jgi:hypothetical protein